MYSYILLCYLEDMGRTDENLNLIHGNRFGAILSQVTALSLHK